MLYIKDRTGMLKKYFTEYKTYLKLGKELYYDHKRDCREYVLVYNPAVESYIRHKNFIHLHNKYIGKK